MRKVAGITSIQPGMKVTVGVLSLLGTVLNANSALAQVGGKSETGHPVRAETVKPKKRPLVRELMLPATLAPDEQVDLYAKISGYVARVNVDIGGRVKKGDVLLKIDVPEMADGLRQAQAVLEARRATVRALRSKATEAKRVLETAKAEVRRYAAQHELDEINLKRQEELFAGDAIPKQALDEARAAHKIAEAQLQIAEAKVAGADARVQSVLADVMAAESDAAVTEAEIARLETLNNYATVIAPFDGIITERHVDTGAFVRSAADGTTTPLFHMAKTDRIRVVLAIPEREAPMVLVGTRVKIEVKATGAPSFPAVVSRTAGAVTPETRTMRAEVDVENNESRLAPGMYARVVVELEANAEAIVIPSKAIRTVGKDNVVYVVADGVVEALPVTIGHDDGIWAEIRSGLQGDESIITATSGAVVPGTAVTVVPSES